MAVIDNTRSSHGSRGGFSVLAHIFGAFIAWNDARATRKSLNALSTRELEDIGLCRGDIDTVVNGKFHF